MAALHVYDEKDEVIWAQTEDCAAPTLLVAIKNGLALCSAFVEYTADGGRGQAKDDTAVTNM